MLMNKNALKIRIRRNDEHAQLFMMLINHPMESGKRRKYPTGEIIPADYITDLHIGVDGEKLADYTLSGNISTTPFVSFTLTRPILEGQMLEFKWWDNHKKEKTYRVGVHFDEKGSFNFSNYKKSAK